jgi:hypothetical protein
MKVQRVARLLLFAFAGSASLVAFLRADDAAPKKEPASLDAQLLNDLNSELLEGLTPPGEASPAEDGASEVAGEDIGAPSTSTDDDNPLTRIEQKMRQVEERLARHDSSAGTQDIQREIADELAALLKQLQQQQNQNQNSQNSQQQEEEQQSSAAKKQHQKQASKANPSNQPANKPARESEDRNRKTSDEKIKPEDLQDLIQSAWGSLPPQVLDRMKAAAQEQFLPQYQTLIEDYFQRLAEERR